MSLLIVGTSPSCVACFIPWRFLGSSLCRLIWNFLMMCCGGLLLSLERALPRWALLIWKCMFLSSGSVLVLSFDHFLLPIYSVLLFWNFYLSDIGSYWFKDYQLLPCICLLFALWESYCTLSCKPSIEIFISPIVILISKSSWLFPHRCILVLVFLWGCYLMRAFLKFSSTPCVARTFLCSWQVSQSLSCWWLSSKACWSSVICI